MASGLAILTGVPGWLGTRLLGALQARHPHYPADAPTLAFDRVRCLVQPSTSVNGFREIAPDVEVIEGDLRDQRALRQLCGGADGATVLHLAGVIDPTRRVRELFEGNVVGSRNLIVAASAAGARRVVAMSSNSPVGAHRDPSTRFDERSPYNPYLAYGRSKRLMEDALTVAHAAGLVETVILRPCWLYRPEQPARQTIFFRMIRQGRAPIVGGGTAMRSMSYVDDAALGLLLAAARDEAGGETYWIADQRPYAVKEIVDMGEELLAEEFGIPVTRRR